jgi:hypothetical protein
VAAGGYFRVFFDSVRHVGISGNARQIRGTAIRIPSGEFNEYEEDPSLPAFYVQGREFGTGWRIVQVAWRLLRQHPRVHRRLLRRHSALSTRRRNGAQKPRRSVPWRGTK